MRSRAITHYRLEARGGKTALFTPPLAGMFDEAKRLAIEGNVEAALTKAADAYVENYGNMHGITFRVVKTEHTIYQQGGWDSFAENEP